MLMLRGKIACIFCVVALSAAFCGLVVLSGCSCSNESARSSVQTGSVFEEVGKVDGALSTDSDSSASTSGNPDEGSEGSSQYSTSEDEGTSEPGTTTSISEGVDASSDDESEVLVTMDEITGPIFARDVPTINGYFEDIFFDPTIYGVTSEEFIDTFFDGFSCKVIDLDTLSDGTVEVDLHIVTRNGQQAVDLLTDAYQDMLKTGAAIDCKQVMEDVGTITYDDPNYFKAYLIKNNNDVWELKDKAAFGTALLGGYDPRQVMGDMDEG